MSHWRQGDVNNGVVHGRSRDSHTTTDSARPDTCIRGRHDMNSGTYTCTTGRARTKRTRVGDMPHMPGGKTTQPPHADEYGHTRHDIPGHTRADTGKPGQHSHNGTETDKPGWTNSDTTVPTRASHAHPHEHGTKRQEYIYETPHTHTHKTNPDILGTNTGETDTGKLGQNTRLRQNGHPYPFPTPPTEFPGSTEPSRETSSRSGAC